MRLSRILGADLGGAADSVNRTLLFSIANISGNKRRNTLMTLGIRVSLKARVNPGVRLIILDTCFKFNDSRPSLAFRISAKGCRNPILLASSCADPPVAYF